jgi:hypothetical protein
LSRFGILHKEKSGNPAARDNNYFDWWWRTKVWNLVEINEAIKNWKQYVYYKDSGMSFLGGTIFLTFWLLHMHTWNHFGRMVKKGNFMTQIV